MEDANPKPPAKKVVTLSWILQKAKNGTDKWLATADDSVASDRPNPYLSSIISAAHQLNNEQNHDLELRTELDSHANMTVVGQNSYIVMDTGKLAEVNPYNPDYKSMRLPIVDATLQYDCPYSGDVFILVVRNAIFVKFMNNNLLPPFALQEAGIVVNETPKIQIKDPSVEDHSFFFPETGERIPLSLWGIFSYFLTTKPASSTLQETENVYVLTPPIWNPHDDSYAKNEEHTLDWAGSITQRNNKNTIMLS